MFGLLDVRSGSLIAGVLLLALIMVGVSAWRKSERPASFSSLLASITRSLLILVAALVVLGLLMLTGETATILGFLVLSLVLLREFLTYGERELHTSQAVIVGLCAVVALQFWFVWERWNIAYSAFIPLVAFFFLPFLHTFSREPGFLHRTAIVQWALMLCVFSVSHTAALLQLPAILESGRDTAQHTVAQVGSVTGAHYLLFAVVTVAGARILEKITLHSTRNRGLSCVAGALGAVVLTFALLWMLPAAWYLAATAALVGYGASFASATTLASICRDRGFKDFAPTIAGFDSLVTLVVPVLCASPVIFYLMQLPL